MKTFLLFPSLPFPSSLPPPLLLLLLLPLVRSPLPPPLSSSPPPPSLPTLPLPQFPSLPSSLPPLLLPSYSLSSSPPTPSPIASLAQMYRAEQSSAIQMVNLCATVDEWVPGYTSDAPTAAPSNSTTSVSYQHASTYSTSH